MNFDKIIHTYLQPELSQLAPKYSLLKLANIIKSVKQTKRYIDQNVNLRLALENLFLEF